ncbi:GNAT family N-acetyltransferase [Desnuesiella massiliensis]|uniref:GNAT family N-acetyltransferase n=1 Tax=Desnuesiella massiliensis TaxID=1650662 RepID=UPI0006E1EC93|nr:GNAT family N-acetyltransferase [Desnuesiella massiliensis]
MQKQIDTQRLIIRRFNKEDWQDLHEYLSDEEVVFYEPYETFNEEASKEEAERRAEDDSFFAVCLKETGKVIGNLYLGKQDFETYELGYVFNKKYQKQGFAIESAERILDYAIEELKARRIIAMCNPKNEPSWKLLERLNMRREGHLIKNIYFKVDENNQPIWLDTYEYAILASERSNKND